MKAQLLLPIAGLLILLAGCAVGPNYHPPHVETAANWSEPLTGGPNNGAVTVVEWWKTFHDPELNSLIGRAVQGNQDLRLALGRLLEARSTQSGAIWDLGPTINTDASFTKQQISKNTLSTLPSGATTTTPRPATTAQPRLTKLYNGYFDASWEIDLFGSKRRTLEADMASLAASEEDRRDVLVTVLSDVARYYMEVRGDQQRLAITRKNIASQAQSIQLTQARFKAGVTSEVDVDQAEALMATTEAQLPPIDTDLKQAVHRLGVLLGEQPGALIAELSRDEPIPTTPPRVPVGLPSELLRRRPDVRRAERQLAASVANIGVETAELFPKINLASTAGFQSISASDLLTGGSRYYTLGPTVTWRLLDFGRIHARIKGANARQQQALATYEQTVLTAFEDVENALVAYSNEQVRYKALDQSVLANQQAMELSEKLYAKGYGDFLSVLDSERSLYSSEDQLVDSRRAVTQDLVALYKALGGGWETDSFALR